jgi:hypothetical protein
MVFLSDDIYCISYLSFYYLEKMERIEEHEDIPTEPDFSGFIKEEAEN